MNGLIVHDGMFTDMKYRAEIKAKNMLALNTKSTDNDYFYGKAYATGTVNIFGDEKEANIQIKAVSQPNSRITSYNVCYTKLLRYDSNTFQVAEA